MCACKKSWRDQEAGHKIDHHYRKEIDATQSQPRKMPPLLRLDSTGESADKKFCKNKWCKKVTDNPHRGKSETTKPHCLKNWVHNYLNMGIDTASGYIDSATSYLGYNQHKKAAETSLAESQTQSPLKSFSKMWGKIGSRDSDMTSVVNVFMETNSPVNMPNVLNKDKVMNKSDINRDPTATVWPKGLLGACDLFGKQVTCPNAYNCDNRMYTSSVPQSCNLYHNDKHRRVHKTTVDNDRDSNHNSKPYNARLLEKSKKPQIFNQEKADNDKELYVPPFARSAYKSCASVKQTTCDTDIAASANAEQKHGHDGSVEFKSVKSDHEKEHRLNHTQEKDNVKEDKDAHHVVPDWFDYESVNVTTIPVLLHTTSTAVNQTSSKYTNNRTATCKTTPSSPLLHSWHSMEYDADVKKTNSKCDTSNPHDPTPSQIFNVIGSNRTGNEEDCNGSDFTKVHVKMKTMTAERDEKSDVDDKKTDKTERNGSEFTKVHIKMETVSMEPNEKSDIDNDKPKVPSENEKLPFVLYVRNCQGSKKSRPSAKKRRRQKAKQDSVVTSDDKPKSSAIPDSAKSQHINPIAFILGIDTDSCRAPFDSDRQSFLMSCDIDSNSDWSDSDLECDGGPDDSPTEDGMQDEFSSLFSPFADQFNPLNFKVTCSIQTTPTTQTSSTLDAINLSWNVDISVEKENSEKTSAKRVHFAADKDLATVHKMVTWSHAYQACRKGPWETYARDRDRFHRRIQETEAALNSVLTQQHRDKVFQERFNAA